MAGDAAPVRARRGKGSQPELDVLANDEVVLRDFSPAKAAGGALKATYQRFPVTVNGGKLLLEFRAKGGEALIRRAKPRNRGCQQGVAQGRLS